MTQPIVRWVLAKRSVFISFKGFSMSGLVVCRTDAVRSLGLLAGGVRPDGRALNDRAGIDSQDAVADRHSETIHATWRRASSFLPNLVVLGAVAGALKPL